jgi:hypothetical protein
MRQGGIIMGFFGDLFKKQNGSYYEKRNRPRLSCAIPTEMMDPKGKLWGCKIVDMSENGFGIITTASLKLGSTLNILKPSIQTQVVWIKDNRAGLRAVR